jgi:hypothetical protein
MVKAMEIKIRNSECFIVSLNTEETKTGDENK